MGPALLINYYYPSSPVSKFNKQHLGEDLFRTFLYSFYSVYYFEAVSKGFKSGSEDRPVGLKSLYPLLVIWSWASYLSLPAPVSSFIKYESLCCCEDYMSKVPRKLSNIEKALNVC